MLFKHPDEHSGAVSSPHITRLAEWWKATLLGDNSLRTIGGRQQRGGEIVEGSIVRLPWAWNRKANNTASDAREDAEGADDGAVVLHSFGLILVVVSTGWQP